MVVVDIDADLRPKIIYLYFENFGCTPAHDVHVTFNPPLQSTVGDGEFVSFFADVSNLAARETDTGRLGLLDGTT